METLHKPYYPQLAALRIEMNIKEHIHGYNAQIHIYLSTICIIDQYSPDSMSFSALQDEHISINI